MSRLWRTSGLSVIVSEIIVVTLDARMSCDVFTRELKIKDPKGVERKPTPNELSKIMNGYKIYSLEAV